MARGDQPQAAVEPSFLYGGNAAYLEQLQAAYEKDPTSVDPQWRGYFDSLNDEAAAVTKSARGASWKAPNWPQIANGELVSVLDGNWATVEKAVGDKIKLKHEEGKQPPSDADIKQATQDSVRALMMIRAFRMRGHLHADLDPLGPRADPRP